jgi:hypothetical protein
MESELSPSEKLWISSLHLLVDQEISLHLSLGDFKHFFHSKQEHTASSPLGHHFGHYKTLLECICQSSPLIPQIIIDIACISLSTASPLHHWQMASQVMLEKGKGQFIDHLRIIRLCEADLNFILHVIWGHCLIWHANKYSALNISQFALPGQTCNNAVLNKVLFFDLSRQSLSPGVLTDFDATSDRVLVALSIATCKRVGLPIVAGHFMFLLLKHMQFHLMTGFGKSTCSYQNNKDGIIRQGVLQGSSSAASLFILNSDVTLSAYNKEGIGASFIHPINGSCVSDSSVQFVDDTSQFLNPLGISSQLHIPLSDINSNILHHTASSTSQKWSDLLWVSGGYLNLNKCYYYAFSPSINYKSNKIQYSTLDFDQGITIQHPLTGSSQCIPGVLPQDSKRTLGVVISPDGNGSKQLQLLINKARENLGKFINSSLSQREKWIAVTTVIEPSLSYPLVNTFFKEKDAHPLDSIISQM